MFEFSNGLVGSPRIKVYDHTKLQDHLESIGVSLEEINFFTWRALPDKSHGKFLVYEKQWIESGIVNNENPPVYLHIKSRTPSDTEIEKVFNVDITGTAFIMSPNQKTTEELPPENEGDPPQVVNHGQDGERLLIIEVELIRTKSLYEEENQSYHKANRQYGSHENFSDLKDLFNNNDLLSVSPEVFNRYEILDISLAEYVAYLASTHFLTAYISGDGSPATLTDQLFEYPDPADNPMLYNKVITRQFVPKIKIVLKDDNSCEATYYKSDELDLTWGVGEDVTEEYFYQSPVAYNSQTPDWEVLIPFAMVDHIKAESDVDHGKNEANRFAEQIQEYASTRLLRDVDIIYQGLVLSPLSNDVQNITYYFQGYDGGMRTRVRSIPWEVPSCQAWLRNLIGSERIYKGYLLTDLAFGNASEVQGHTTARALIVTMSGNLIELSKIVFEDTEIFQDLKAGMTVLLYRESSDCEFNIIQSECPPESPPPTAQGKCCVELTIQNGPVRNYCIVTTQLVCQKIGGTWTAGQTCNDPYCE